MSTRTAVELWHSKAADDGRGKSKRPADVQRMAAAVPMRAQPMFVSGVGAAAAGLILAFINPIGFLGVALASSLMTIGGGLTFLGIIKTRARPSIPALPEAPQTVLAERSRRIARLLDERGPQTYEAVLAALAWTEDALLPTLLRMKESGVVVEDLDLESGQWVYAPGDPASAGQASALMLEERRRQIEGAKTG